MPGGRFVVGVRYVGLIGHSVRWLVRFSLTGVLHMIDGPTLPDTSAGVELKVGQMCRPVVFLPRIRVIVSRQRFRL